MKRNKERNYIISLGILLGVIILQWVLLAQRTPPAPSPAVKPAPAPLAKKYLGTIAIVLDDWGYSLKNIPTALQITAPLTASILPHLDHTQEVSRILHTKGWEVMLHLPMEPNERYRMEKNTITTNLPDDYIRGILKQNLLNVRYARGVNNHMGSRATEDPRVMGVILRELKRQRLYFLDSFVTPRTVCGPLARTLGVKFAKRDIFLDNKEDSAYIWSQINKLKNKAKLYGFAIGIGHDRKLTLAVLKDAIPRLEKEGYRFVRLSELMR